MAARLPPELQQKLAWLVANLGPSSLRQYRARYPELRHASDAAVKESLLSNPKLLLPDRRLVSDSDLARELERMFREPPTAAETRYARPAPSDFPATTPAVSLTAEQAASLGRLARDVIQTRDYQRREREKAEAELASALDEARKEFDRAVRRVYDFTPATLTGPNAMPDARRATLARRQADLAKAVQRADLPGKVKAATERYSERLEELAKELSGDISSWKGGNRYTVGGYKEALALLAREVREKRQPFTGAGVSPADLRAIEEALPVLVEYGVVAPRGETVRLGVPPQTPGGKTVSVNKILEMRVKDFEYFLNIVTERRKLAYHRLKSAAEVYDHVTREMEKLGKGPVPEGVGKATAYHAGMSAADRAHVQNVFMLPPKEAERYGRLAATRESAGEAVREHHAALNAVDEELHRLRGVAAELATLTATEIKMPAELVEGLKGYDQVIAALRYVLESPQARAQAPQEPRSLDWTMKSGPYLGHRISDTPLEYLMWIAAGAEIKREFQQKTYSKEKPLKLPPGLKRVYHEPVFQADNNMFKRVREYLRSDHGQRRLKAYLGELHQQGYDEAAASIVSAMEEFSARVQGAKAYAGTYAPRSDRKVLTAAEVRAETERREKDLAWTQKRLALKYVYRDAFKAKLEETLKKYPQMRRDKAEFIARGEAHKAYQEALQKAGLSDFQYHYRDFLERGMTPEEADKAAKFLLKDARRESSFDVPTGFQETQLSRRERDALSREEERTYRESDRERLRYLQEAKRFQDRGGRLTRQEYDAIRAQLLPAARLTYERLRQEGRLPAWARGRTLESLSGYEVWKLGRIATIQVEAGRFRNEYIFDETLIFGDPSLKGRRRAWASGPDDLTVDVGAYFPDDSRRAVENLASPSGYHYGMSAAQAERLDRLHQRIMGTASSPVPTRKRLLALRKELIDFFGNMPEEARGEFGDREIGMWLFNLWQLQYERARLIEAQGASSVGTPDRGTPEGGAEEIARDDADLEDLATFGYGEELEADYAGERYSSLEDAGSLERRLGMREGGEYLDEDPFAASVPFVDEGTGVPDYGAPTPAQYAEQDAARTGEPTWEAEDEAATSQGAAQRASRDMGVNTMQEHYADTTEYPAGDDDVARIGEDYASYLPPGVADRGLRAESEYEGEGRTIAGPVKPR